MQDVRPTDGGFVDRAGVGRHLLGSYSGCAVPVAPSFADFSGRTWESRFPEFLASYYDTCREVGRSGLWGFLDRGHGPVVNASCDRTGTTSGDVRTLGNHVGSGGCTDVWRRGFCGVATCVGVEGAGDAACTVGSVGSSVPGSNVSGTEGGRFVEECSEVGSFGGRSGPELVGDFVAAGKYVPPAKRGPKGGLSVGRGPNYDKNQAARQRKKEVRGFRGIGQAVRMPTFDACDQSVRDELQRTRANRLVVENKLRTVKMEQELEVARSRDVQQMIQQQRTQLLRQTELNRVQIEKAHGSLSGEVAGSVPIVPTAVGGTVETVLTGGSISPSSSISEAEIRKLHKDFLDGQARIAKLEKDNYKLRFGVHQEDSEGGPDDGALWDGGEDSVSQDQFSYRSGYMCTPEQREENKKLALELRGW